jgi:phage-related minor tail protein
MGGGSAIGDEALDPRSPRYNPAAAEQARRDAALAEIRESFEVESGGGGGGGGGGGDVFTSLIPGIEALAEAVRLANEQTQAYEQSVDILDDALQHGLITQQEYNTLLTQAQEAYGQAQTAAYDYEAAIEQVANKASSAMEDAFMSIVDGSATAADAFRNMAREILAEAFKMLVVRPIMNSLFGGGGGGGILGGLFGGVSQNEYGNAFHAGRVIPFANGGVVSSPTMFPMRGNQTGLMGEAGPEAIMPLKRGRDGKLGVQAEGGGGQSIVIHQSFNFQANGDESVKRIIAQEAPKIANLTQQQIIDQRKRGGVMKGAFG